MSVGEMVRWASEVLGRAHLLFGGPPSGPGPAVSGDLLRRGANDVALAHVRMSSLAGQLPTRAGTFATDAGTALDGLASSDDQLHGRVAAGGVAVRDGRTDSGRVIDAAADDTARIAPVTTTTAGQRALVTALRDRIREQQQVVAAYQARDARMATLIRTLAYSRSAGVSAAGGGAPLVGGGAGGLPSLAPAVGGPGGGAGGRGTAPRIERVGNWSGVPPGPAGVAVAAALSKRGRPYGWGAKGPNVFDCSGLTQWAWRQAGVQLGGDTYSQIDQGVPVPPDQVRAGDLIFPASAFSEDGRHGPGHVMLAISSTEVVHAPHTGDVVRVAPMPSRFVARRPVPLTRD